MKILVTAGPTRERIDAVRFITNASSGQMGCAVAVAAAQTGAEVTLLAGPGVANIPAGVTVERFESVEELQALLAAHFPDCDALVMAAAVGDFTVAPQAGKISRSAGPITLELSPTEDLLAGLAAGKRPGQKIVSFSVEEGSDEAMLAKAVDEMGRKGADFCVLNTAAAMSASESRACILGPDGTVLPWGERPKTELAQEIVKLILIEK